MKVEMPTVTIQNAGKETVRWSTEGAELRAGRDYRNTKATVVTLAASESVEVWRRFDLDLAIKTPPRFDASLKLGDAIRLSGEKNEVVVPLGADLQMRSLGNFPQRRRLLSSSDPGAPAHEFRRPEVGV